MRWVFLLHFLWEIRTEVRIRGESRVLCISSLFIFIKNAVSCRARHFVAGFAELATVYLFHKKTIALPCFAAPPFRNPLRFALLQRKITRFPRVPWSRSVRLFACKRAHNGSLSLPTFCGQVRYHHSFCISPRHSGGGFRIQKPRRSTRFFIGFDLCAHAVAAHVIVKLLAVLLFFLLDVVQRVSRAGVVEFKDAGVVHG